MIQTRYCWCENEKLFTLLETLSGRCVSVQSRKHKTDWWRGSWYVSTLSAVSVDDLVKVGGYEIGCEYSAVFAHTSHVTIDYINHYGAYRVSCYWTQGG
jgi:hypothetical protein